MIVKIYYYFSRFFQYNFYNSFFTFLNYKLIIYKPKDLDKDLSTFKNHLDTFMILCIALNFPEQFNQKFLVDADSC